ncbi:MAG: FAD-dependent oxidoreductase [Bacteroidales bacterium]|nr:FAD-dependent oxidoreductase [Candidatus Cryptobacteroides aphodequi]
MSDCPRNIAIIGAGAAGCFCAIELKRRLPATRVTVYEAGRKALAKVAVTGGGRCNLTNSFDGIGHLAEAYPRGERLVKRAFTQFGPRETMAWWEKEGVRLVVQSDNCVFPASQDAMQIVRTLENLMRRLGVEVVLDSRVERIEPLADGRFALKIVEKANSTGHPSAGIPGTAGASTVQPFRSVETDAVVLTSGGGALKMLDGLDIAIEKPVPSLFTFKLKGPAASTATSSASLKTPGTSPATPGATSTTPVPAVSDIRSLAGTVVENAKLALVGTAFRSEATLLITDWGVSGPATLKLSSYAARHLAETLYGGTLTINYTGVGEDDIRRELSRLIQSAPQRQLASTPAFGLTARLWKHLIARAGIRADIRNAELGSKGLNRLVATLSADAYELAGRCHFKEEFVTCGGVSASAVNANTLESRNYAGLFFAGEVLDIDGITGGFNLQAAWSTAMAVARAISQK